MEHDEGMGPFSVLRVGASDDGDFENVGMGRELGLDEKARRILPAALQYPNQKTAGMSKEGERTMMMSFDRSWIAISPDGYRTQRSPE